MGKKRLRRKIGKPSPQSLEARAAGIVFTVSRKEAIARVLDTAIWMWFSDHDPLAVHLLTCSCYQSLDDLGRGKSDQGPILRHKILQGLDMFAAYDFLRHADEHPAAELDFAPQMNAPLLFDAVAAFQSIFGPPTVFMRTFNAYFIISPDLNVSERVRSQADNFLPNGVAVNDVDNLSRLDFFRKVTVQFAAGGGAHIESP